MRTTPALTMVAEWRKALTGVGAAMAPGSQNWNGTWADLAMAPRRMSTSPTCTTTWVVSARASSLRAVVPAAWETMARPPRRARPPAPVTSRAWRAAARAARVLVVEPDEEEAT